MMFVSSERRVVSATKKRQTRDDEIQQASVVMQRLSYSTETVLSNKITRNKKVLSFKDSPRKPLGRRPSEKGRNLAQYFRYSCINKGRSLDEG